MKRKAEYELTREILENGDCDQSKDNAKNNHDTSTLQTPDEIAQRKILKIKGAKVQEPTVDSSNVTFKLNQPLQEDKKEPIKKSFSFLSESSEKNENQPQQSLFSTSNMSSGLFSNVKAESGSIFGNNTSIFGNTPSVGGLFGDKPSGGLFGDKPSGGLFGDKPSGGLFGDKPSGGLFSQSLLGQTTGGLFGSQNTQNQQQSSLFQNLQGAQLNFSQQSQQNGQNSDGESEEGDNEPLAADDEAEVDPSKTTGNYQYEETSHKIITKNIQKFKIQAESFEAGSLSIEKIKDSAVPLIIFRNKLKNIMFTGMLFKKVSQFSNLNKKENCLQVQTFVDNKQKEESKDEKQSASKFKTEICKIMFNNDEDCIEFKNELKKLVE